MTDASGSSGGPPKRLAGWLDVAVKVGALAAGIFAFYEYAERRKDARVAQTLEHVARFNDPAHPVGKAVSQITTTLQAHEDEMRDLEAAMKANPAAAERLREEFVSRLLGGDEEMPGIADAADRVIRFFESVEVCVEEGLCDARSADAYLADYAAGFWSNFSEALVMPRQDFESEYGTGVKYFRDRADNEEGS